MGEQTPTISRFWRFWWLAIAEAGSESREKFGLLVDLGIPISTTALFLFVAYSKHHKSFDPNKGSEAMSYWCALIPSALWVLWFLYHVPKSAYKLYRKEAEGRLSDNKESAVSIENLNRQLATRSAADQLVEKRCKAKDALGLQLRALDNLLQGAKIYSRITFYGDEKMAYWRHTEKIFSEAESCIKEHLTESETALFSIAKSGTVKEIQGYSGESIMDWIWHVQCIEAKRDALADIIKRLF